METRSTQEARREFAALLEDVLRGQHVKITRHSRPLAVVVPLDWYKKAEAALESGEQQS